jgi:hypothetical protein
MNKDLYKNITRQSTRFGFASRVILSVAAAQTRRQRAGIINNDK